MFSIAKITRVLHGERNSKKTARVLVQVRPIAVDGMITNLEVQIEEVLRDLFR